MSGFCEELEFISEREFLAFVVEDEADALNDFVVVLLNKVLGAEVALIVQVGASSASQVLQKVLSQTVDQTHNILSLPHLLHNHVSLANLYVVVFPRLVVVLPLFDSF